MYVLLYTTVCSFYTPPHLFELLHSVSFIVHVLLSILNVMYAYTSVCANCVRSEYRSINSVEYCLQFEPERAHIARNQNISRDSILKHVKSFSLKLHTYICTCAYMYKTECSSGGIRQTDSPEI